MVLNYNYGSKLEFNKQYFSILIEKSIKKLSDISEIRQQSFENVYDKLASINDIIA